MLTENVERLYPLLVANATVCSGSPVSFSAGSTRVWEGEERGSVAGRWVGGEGVWRGAAPTQPGASPRRSNSMASLVRTRAHTTRQLRASSLCLKAFCSRQLGFPSLLSQAAFVDISTYTYTRIVSTVQCCAVRVVRVINVSHSTGSAPQ